MSSGSHSDTSDRADTCQVLIVGAGPTGLNLALQLTRFGIPFRIIDQRVHISSESRAIAVQANVLEAYDVLGFADSFVQSGKIIRGTRAQLPHDTSSRTALSFTKGGRGASRFNLTLGISQNEHEAFLDAELEKRGVKVERGVQFVSLQPDEESGDMMIALRRDEVDFTISAVYVAGCDGGKSAVRHCTGIKMEGGTYPERFFVADVMVGDRPLVPDTSCLHLSATDFVVAVPLLPEGRYRLIGSVPLGLNDEPDANITYDDIRSHVERTAHINIAPHNWFAVYRSHYRVASAFRDDRIFLLGDAAHLHSPTGGQGLNLGCGDAFNLGWKLAMPTQVMLVTYEAERRPVARQVVKETDKLFLLISGRGWVGWFFRLFVLSRLIPFLTRLLGLIMHQKAFGSISQLGQVYSSTLNGSSDAGRRFPPEYGVAFAGWTLHVFGEVPTWVGQVEKRKGRFLSIVRHRRDEHGKLGEGTWYVVRPDSVLDMRAPRTSTTEIVAYLERWGFLVV